MKVRLTQFSAVSVIGLALACSTTEIAPPLPPAPPAYTMVPHPMGQDINDLVAMFRTASAPALESLKDCDADFKKLQSLTNSIEEVKSGTRELVASDPVKYHWCFYGKVLALNGTLKGDTYVDERQKQALDTYNFLVPVARGFFSEFQDSRYIRFSVTHYRKLSEWIFFRKLEMTPEATSELVDAANPFGLYRTPADAASILSKYAVTPTPAVLGVTGETGAPAAQAAPPTAPAEPLAPAASPSN